MNQNNKARWIIAITILASCLILAHGSLQAGSILAEKLQSGLDVADSFRYPLAEGFMRYYTFGYRHSCGPFHNGVDYHLREEADVYAVADGQVIWIGNDEGGYGKYIAIRHDLPDDETVYSLYAHLAGTQVSDGIEVTKGTVIGTEGKSGSGANGVVHLHFEIRRRWDLLNDKCGAYHSEHLNQWFYNPDKFIPTQAGPDVYGVTLHEHANYRGRSVTLTDKVDDLCDLVMDWNGYPPDNSLTCQQKQHLGIVTWSDNASSITIAPGWSARVHIHNQEDAFTWGDDASQGINCNEDIPDFGTRTFPNGTPMDENISRVFVERCAPSGFGSPGNPQTFGTVPNESVCDPTLPSSTDNVAFLSDATLPDGTVVSPDQALHKVWRVRNSGTSTWDSGYQLVFIGGDQMGAPGSVSVPTAAPSAMADIAVDMTASTTGGTYTGRWRLRNPQGTYFGDELWITITVPGDTPPSGDEIELACLNCPSVVTPGQQFRPTIRATVNSGQLLASRGDMLRNSDGNLYGAWPHVAVVGTVDAGQTYDFTFYADNPITAPSSEGTYASKWRIWRDGSWAGPEINIRFDVRSGGGTRPDAPTLVSPGNWYVSRDGSTPALCASAPSGLQYYFQIYESHDIPESGWISSNCWTPPGLGPYGYQWHAKVRDPGTGLESDWSETRHFNIESTDVTLDPLEFSPASPSAGEEIRVYTCVRGYGGIGLGLYMYANKATDGSANGDWYWIDPAGTFCYDHSDSSTWPLWHSRDLADGTHLIRAIGFHGDQQVVRETTYTLQRRRPNNPLPINPMADTWWNTRQITFRWTPSLRVNNYHLLAGTNPDPRVSPILDVTLPPGVSEYTHTFGGDYSVLYWRVEAVNEMGQAEWITGPFGIDRLPPSSSVENLPATSYDSALTVRWGGTDNAAGIARYDVQYRDGDRGVWTDWQSDIGSTVSLFTGQPGHRYCFRARAVDRAGNREGWPTGDGDTCTLIDPDAAPPAPWWKLGYQHRRNLVVLNNEDSVLPARYPVRLHFDGSTAPTAAELYAASQASSKGDDVRIVYNNTTELSRFVQQFTDSVVDIWFDMQDSISILGSDGTTYQLYYGNSSPGVPPADVNDVFPPGSDANTLGVWHFAEGSGSTLADASGHGNHGTLYNASWETYGKFGSAANFNGTSSYAEIPSSDLFSLGNNFTLEGWFWSYNPDNPRALIRRRMSNDQDDAYCLATRDREIEAHLGGRARLWGLREILRDRWYHLALSYDGQTLRSYINGQFDNSWDDNQGVPSSAGPLVLGRNSNYEDLFFGLMQGVRVSNITRTSFPYASFAQILVEPTTAAGSESNPPSSALADLSVLGLTTFPGSTQTGGGVVVQAVVQNQGDGSTNSGFYTDLYADHLPTGVGDFTGSVRFWVNDPIAAGTTITLTTVITDLGGSLQQSGVGQASQEWTSTLYVQGDSTGVIAEPDDADNISPGTDVCVASPDAYESDDAAVTAQPIVPGEDQMHNFHSLADEDWLRFTASGGVTYTIQTSELGAGADTYLYLYDTDGNTLLSANDDFGGSLASQIEWTAPVTGTYYLLVKHWNPNAAGCGTSYTLSVEETLQRITAVYLPLVLRNFDPSSPVTPTPPLPPEDYRLLQSVVGACGSSAGSANYRSNGTCGQVTVSDVISSANYRISSGYWMGVNR